MEIWKICGDWKRIYDDWVIVETERFVNIESTTSRLLIYSISKGYKLTITSFFIYLSFKNWIEAIASFINKSKGMNDVSWSLIIIYLT